MLPVVRGDRETVKQIVLYSFVMVAATVVPFVWGTLGLAYLVAALVLGGRVHLARRAARPAHGAPRRPRSSSTPRSSTWRWSSSPPPSTWRSRPMLDPETERKNMLLGLGALRPLLLIAAGTVAIAFIYLAVD